MAQLLLIPDARPLDGRLGGTFFRKAPRRPGVYLMKDARDRVIYVGKARDLKQRLNHYRNANPDRMSRRHLRLVNAVTRIDFEFCPTEAAALQREKKLIRFLKPKFNRTGVWPGRPKFIVWRLQADVLELSVMEVPLPDWRRFGPLGGDAIYLQRSLARLLWLAVNPHKAIGELPAGWSRGNFMATTNIPCGSSLEEATNAFEGFFWNEAAEFILWLEARHAHRLHPFERRLLEAELECLKEFGARQPAAPAAGHQLPLL